VHEKTGVIYILTNPSFPDYVKIGFAEDIKKRLKQLNRSECVPFAFRVYATYEVSSKLSDLKIHSIIDKLNPNLRAIDNFNGQKRVREFYAMSPEDAYSILLAIAEIHGMEENLHLIPPSVEETVDAKTAEEVANEKKERLAPFSFEKCDIPVGAEIEFCGSAEKTGLFCVVSEDRHSVMYNNKKWSLSALAAFLLESNWPVAGPRYFKYNGEWLNDIRKRLGV